jgi:hypothetical protein
MLEEAGKRLGITLGGDTPDAAIKEACISHWLDIKVIEMWTDIVSPIIYYPFIVLCLMILSRSPLFDNLGTPYQLMVVFGGERALRGGLRVQAPRRGRARPRHGPRAVHPPPGASEGPGGRSRPSRHRSRS